MSDETFSLITIPALYIFNLLTDLQYNDTEFKRLFINSRTSIQSIRGISQLKALQQLDITLQLDKNTARSANFIFEIGSAAFIRLINLDILLGQIIFYIVLVNIPFLLSLANIDKHRAFFNNITNQVIQSQT